MKTDRVLRIVAGALALLLVRRDLVVRAIRAMDQHGGLASRRSEQAYAGAARLFSGLHHRVARDVVAAAVNGPITVLDIGAGPGSLLLEVASLAPAATLIGVEPSASMREIAAANGLTEIDGRAEDIPLPDASVDIVVSTLSMHHWDDPGRAFAEIRRVLRPGGQARLYDVRFAAYNDKEVRAFAIHAGWGSAAVGRSTLDERLVGLHPYSLTTITQPRPALA